MIHRWSAKRSKNILALIGTASLLLFFPGLTLSACFNANANCSGIDIVCKYPTPTPNRPAIIATANALSHSKPLLTDLLKKQDKNAWDQNDHCFFHGGAYIDTVGGASSLYGCSSNTLNYGNATIRVDVTLLSGYAAGILFRNTASLGEVYDFEITNNGQFDFQAVTQNNSTFLIPVTASSAVSAVGKKNRLIVIASGDDFQFLVNGVFVGETHDSTLTAGSIGVSVTNYNQSTARASFSNLVVYHM